MQTFQGYRKALLALAILLAVAWACLRIIASPSVSDFPYLRRGAAGDQPQEHAHGPPQQPARGQLQEQLVVPVYLSPICAFKKSGGVYAAGEAPSFHSLIFPALTSVRLYDPTVPIVLVTNFDLNASDKEEARRHNLQLWANPESAWGSVCPRTARAFGVYNEVCAIAKPGSGAVYLLRYYQLRCAMEQLRHDMIFFLEGDNLMAESVQTMARMVGLRGVGTGVIDVTHNHVSLHASFMNFEYVEALTQYAAEFVQFASAKHGCPFTGAGQDMKFTYLAALEMHRSRLDRGLRSPANVLSSSGPRPCAWTEHQTLPFEDGVGAWCSASGSTFGPCGLQPLVDEFEQRPSSLQRAERVKKAMNLSRADLLPVLHECRQDALQPCAYWSFQENLQGSVLNPVPSFCPPRTIPFRPLPACIKKREVATSKVFKCITDYETDYNKELVFGDGRAYVLTEKLSVPYKGSYVQSFNLHFQGRGCKGQMEPVFEALQRSKREKSWFTCGFTNSTRSYWDCLSTGNGAVRMDPKQLCDQPKTGYDPGSPR